LGSFTDALSGVDPSSASFRVIDEYGSIQPSGTVSVMSDGSYALIVNLEASRLGGDRDGRRYRIILSVKDKSGNVGSADTDVIVPHDQGQPVIG
jgi:hypothetical protein